MREKEGKKERKGYYISQRFVRCVILTILTKLAKEFIFW